jgi:hypothetical protein
MRYPTLLLAISLVCGCASTYEQVDVTAPSAKLLHGNSIMIATPSDGSYEAKAYSGSGSMTAAAVNAAFAPYSDKISVSAECQDIECLKNQSTPVDYFVVPEILHWEDRNTEWSGKKDKLEVKLSVIDAADGTTLATTIISGKSKWATFGGDHPQDLLPEPLKKYVESLY